MTADWSPREKQSDEGARDKAARMWDRGGRRQGSRGPGGRGGDDGGREVSMVPRAEFASYYGRAVLKPPVWKDDIAYYFFLGGLSAGSSLLAAGADLTGRATLRKGSRLAAVGTIAVGAVYLVKDLGRPERFHHMLRVAKPTSPMSVGTWVITAYAPAAGLAAMAELLPTSLRARWPGRLIGALARPAGLSAALLAPAVASYTAVLLSQTAVPAWHEAHEELPFVFTASAVASAAGLGMVVSPVSEAGPARRLAAYGALVELLASRRMEQRLGLVGEPFTSGRAGSELRRAASLTVGGAATGVLLGGRSRAASVVAGVALLAGGFYERLGLFHAGVAASKDPKYVVVPQRERLRARDGLAPGSAPA